MEKNIYFNILKIYINKSDTNIVIKNISSNKINILNDNQEVELSADEIINLKLINNTINIIDNNIKKEFKINFNFLEQRGFDKECIIETPMGKKEIQCINAGDYVLDKNGSPLLVKNVYVFSIDKKSTNKPIVIEKSKCGLNLPYSKVTMSMKSVLKIKKVTLKGRSLFLNGKAKLLDFNDIFYYYALETENKEEFLLSGFVTDSI